MPRARLAPSASRLGPNIAACPGTTGGSVRTRAGWRRWHCCCGSTAQQLNEYTGPWEGPRPKRRQVLWRFLLMVRLTGPTQLLSQIRRLADGCSSRVGAEAFSCVMRSMIGYSAVIDGFLAFEGECACILIDDQRGYLQRE